MLKCDNHDNSPHVAVVVGPAGSGPGPVVLWAFSCCCKFALLLFILTVVVVAEMLVVVVAVFGPFVLIVCSWCGSFMLLLLLLLLSSMAVVEVVAVMMLVVMVVIATLESFVLRVSLSCSLEGMMKIVQPTPTPMMRMDARQQMMMPIRLEVLFGRCVFGGDWGSWWILSIWDCST